MHPVLKFIENNDALISMYGDQLSFHDSEITRIELTRGSTNLGECFLNLDIHLFAFEGVSPEGGKFIHGRHCVASFQFESIQDLELDGFNHQNAIMDFSIDPIESPENGANLKVTIDPAFGLSATFTCFKCTLMGLIPEIPAGSVYA